MTCDVKAVFEITPIPVFEVKFAKNHPDAVIPFYAHGVEDAGMDLFPVLSLTEVKEGSIDMGEDIFRSKKKTVFDQVQEIFHSNDCAPPINEEDAPFVELAPRTRVVFDTGLRIRPPHGCECQVRTRSGLSSKQGLVVLNSPGTVDPGYRGALKVIILNTSDAFQRVNRGTAIAQLVVAPVYHPKVTEVSVEDFDDTARGTQGFGSTDKA